MLKKIRKVFLHDLVRITSWSSVSYFIKTVSQFIISKVLAVTIGPAGVAILGQLTNISGIIQSLGSAGISIGVTKYIAENYDNEVEQQKVIDNSLKLVFYTSAGVGLLTLLFFKAINRYFLANSNYSEVVLIAGLTVLLFAINTTIVAVINGLQQYKQYIYITILNSLFNLFLVLVFVKIWGFKGALYALVTTPALLFFISYSFVYKKSWFSFKFLFTKFDYSILKKLSAFSLMAINNAVVGALGQIILRSLIIKRLSITEAGLWDSLTKLSNAYMLLITTSIQVYFLPALAAISDSKLLWKELIRANKILLPLIGTILILIFIFRTEIILLLFTKQFLPLQEYFKFQLVGDLIKISSWIFAYTMYARAMTKRLILTDNFFTALNISLAYLFVIKMHLAGIFVAYLCSSLIYFVFIVVFIRKQLNLKFI